ncbi:Gene Transfer Agent host specificity protein [hydrothermal vent metagenome]|uniref:Gene Transfer Agent host specificity protein n=1 Tax=hydrothermal vent metagenome TaxID=652676 RepID=A0A3B0RX14_9ZZZZ
MATLVMQAAGQAVGGFLGGPFGAVLGRAVGGIAGSFVDQALFGSGTKRIEGPRLKELQLLGSTEGAPIPKIYGRVRISGQVIWATRFDEIATTRTQRSGGKGGTGRPKTKVTEYAYYANFAIGLCQGRVNRIGRVWADGKEIDISKFVWRLHDGRTDQQPDSLIIAKQGQNEVPAFRGTAYIVFEHLPLEQFGNRLPQLSFEVFKSLNDVEGKISAVNIIPGATEFGYDPISVRRSDGWGTTVAENTHTAADISDWTASIDQLQATCENVNSASLVVAWFGDDLRCDQIKIRPGIETRDKTTTPLQWSVAGLSRGAAPLISLQDGKVAFGSTPDDGSVVRAITDLHDRGIKPVFYPFIMMDIPADTQLPDPYNPSGTQPPYPWRGKITCDPAIGQPATPDKTAAIAAQVNAFFGSAQAADFSVLAGQVVYSGPTDWGFRRMILHYAHLCQMAGGVDAFLIGSELKSLTILRDDQHNFPAVTALKNLAAEVAQVLPDAKISYAADWSEYFGYHPQNSSGDVYFHLDELWASPDVDFIGIDNYMPLSDWRDGFAHLDAQSGARSIYDRDYLQQNITGGEGFDWFYASQSDREIQQRTPITDGAYNKPWVYRYKDLKSWWQNPHHNRPGGVEDAAPTSWVPQSKPFWFTEVGCPAIDKGTNQPNVFVDPKSVESNAPHFSSGQRDDFIQRKYIDVVMQFWSSVGSHNPVSLEYAGTMVAAEQIFMWAWDARPYPAFPFLSDVWTDGENYDLGHWLNGRLGAAPLSNLVAEILQDYGFSDHQTGAIHGLVDGYVIERTMSARQAIDPLAAAFFFDGVESAGLLKFRRRDEISVLSVSIDDLVESKADKPVFTLKRAQETDLPNRVQLLFIDGENNYRQSVVEARKLTGASQRDIIQELPAVLSQNSALGHAEVALQEIWTGRETADFILPPSLAELEVGDVLTLVLIDGQQRFLRVESLTDGDGRAVSARLTSRENYQPAAGNSNTGSFDLPAVFGPPLFEVMSLPLLSSSANPFAPWIAARAAPWPGNMAITESAGSGFTEIENLNVPAIIGEILTDLPAGPLSRIDYANSLTIELASGELSSVSRHELLAGSNLLAVGSEQSGWEVLQFENAELTGTNTYEITHLLRGQVGSNPEMLPLRLSGARCVLLDGAVRQIPATADDQGRERLMRIGPGHLDHADPAFVEFSHAASGISLRPLNPVHLKVKPVTGGVQLSWVRRTRIDGDSWALLEVPLGEEVEEYAIEIMDGQTLVRIMSANQPLAIYSDVEREADFGLPLPSTLTFRVAQISAIYGPGTYQEKTFNV